MKKLQLSLRSRKKHISRHDQSTFKLNETEGISEESQFVQNLDFNCGFLNSACSGGSACGLDLNNDKTSSLKNDVVSSRPTVSDKEQSFHSPLLQSTYSVTSASSASCYNSQSSSSCTFVSMHKSSTCMDGDREHHSSVNNQTFKSLSSREETSSSTLIAFDCPVQGADLYRMQNGTVSEKRQTTLLSFFHQQASNSKTHRKLPTVSEHSYSQCRSSTLRQVIPLQKSQHTKRPVGTQSTSSQHHRRTCPFYKRIPGTGFTVDAFSYGTISNCTAYFLSHFHSDHYIGLTSRFQHSIYCSNVTANLVRQKLKVCSEYVKALNINKPYNIDGVEVIFLDANHCPGSVMILFKLPSGKSYLHTGDFRFSDVMLDCHYLLGINISQLFLDTTYCSPQYDFPKQVDVIAFAVDKVLATLERHPNTLIVCGTYTIGKEKIFMAIAEALCRKVCVYKEKKAVLDCLSDEAISKTTITDPNSSNIHVIPIGKLTVEVVDLYCLSSVKHYFAYMRGIHMSASCQYLTAYLEQHKSKYTALLAFKPTGWTHSKTYVNMGSIKPVCRGPVTIYGVPYSEHSSFSELRQFVQFIRPQRIIPTVNNSSSKKREEMLKTFEQWLQIGKSVIPPKLKQGTLDRVVATCMPP